jgi:hypothetical protein
MRGRVLQLFTVALLELGAGAAAAMSVESIDIGRSADAYTVAFDVVIAAPVVDVRRLLTDYREWSRLSRSVQDTKLVAVPSADVQRIKVTLRSCVVADMFCRMIVQVKDLEALADGVGLMTKFVPGQGDFESGTERWRLVADGESATRLRYQATFVPAFDVPPFVGPWLLKRALRRELIDAAQNLERVAAQAP